MTVALVAVNGVLKNTQGLPITEGVRLVDALSERYRVYFASEDIDDDAMWLQIENIRTPYVKVLDTTPGSLRGLDPRLGQIEYLQGRGEHVAIVVDPDPTRISLALEKGIPALLFSHPSYARPEWRPDHTHEVTPWSEMVATIEKQRLAESLGEE